MAFVPSDETFYPYGGHVAGWPPRSKFTLLAYLFELLREGEDTVPFDFSVSSERVGSMIIRQTSKRRGGGPAIQALIEKVKAAIKDDELHIVYGEPVVIVTAENYRDEAINMNFIDRFRSLDHEIDKEHLRERFGSITRVEVGHH